MIYLDYAAHCPVEKEVLDVYYQASLKYFANPNAMHTLGLQAQEKIDQTTKEIAKKLNVLPEEIIYTSGASEANNLAIKGTLERYKHRGKHILISALEHNSILSSATKMQEYGFEVEIIPINKDGRVDLERLVSLIRKDTILVSVCGVDSELGIRQPIEEIAAILKNYPYCFFHCDASQATGKVSIDFSNVDLVTIAPHKFYGLLSTGLLIKKKRVGLKSQIDGGKSTTTFRSGTPDLCAILSINKALEISLINQDERVKHVRKLNQLLRTQLSQYKEVMINSTDYSIDHVLNISLMNIKATDFVRMLDQHQVYLSSKTYCCPTQTPSKMVYALTQDRKRSLSSFRISLSHLTSEDEIKEFLTIFDQCYKECL